MFQVRKSSAQLVLAHRPVPRRLDAWGPVLVLAAAPTLVFPGRWTVAGVAVLVLVWLTRWLATGRLSVRTPLDWPIALLLLAVAIGTAVSSVPSASTSKAWGIVLGVSLYYALVNALIDLRRALWAANGLVLVGIGISLAALVGTDWSHAQSLPVPGLDTVYRHLPTLVRGVPGSGLPTGNDLFNPREVGGSLALLLPLAVVPLMRADQLTPARRALLGAGSLIMAVVLLLTQTPTAIAGVLLALWLAAILVDGARRLWWVLGGLALGLAGLAALWARLAALGLADRSVLGAAEMGGAAHAGLGLAARLELWPRALQMLHDTPYTGIGLNTFPWVMNRFYPGFVLGPEPHAHNLLLHTAADLGVIGLVALIWLLLAFGCSLWAAFRDSNATARCLILALGAGLLAHLVFGTLDTVTLGAKPGLALWAVLGLGMALSRAAKPDAYGARAGRWVSRLSVAFLILTLLVPLSWNGVQLNLGHLAAYRAFLPDRAPPSDDADLARARSALESAAYSDPRDSGTWYLLGSVLAGAGEHGAAVQALRQGFLADRDQPFRRYAPAEALAQAGSGDELADLRRVYEHWMLRFPRRAEWYVTQAVLLGEGQGDRAAATAMLERGRAAGAEPSQLLNEAAEALGRRQEQR